MRLVILLFFVLQLHVEAHAQEEYIGKHFDSVYAKLSQEYIVSENAPTNPESKFLVRRAPLGV